MRKIGWIIESKRKQIYPKNENDGSGWNIKTTGETTKKIMNK